MKINERISKFINYAIESEYRLIILSNDYEKIISDLRTFINMYGSTKDVGYAKIKLGELLMERGHLYSKYLADAIDYLKSCDTEEAHRKTIEGMLLYLKIYKTDYTI